MLNRKEIEIMLVYITPVYEGTGETHENVFNKTPFKKRTTEQQ
jgi:hypothetical protein